MAELAVIGVQQSLKMIDNYDSKSAEEILAAEDKVDYYEDKLGSYLVKLSSHSLNQEDSNEASKLLHLISDFERISDHSVNILYSAEECHSKHLTFSDAAQNELKLITSAVSDILDLALASFRDDDMQAAVQVEPLEQVVDNLKEIIRSNHITRLQNGECTIELGFILTDLLTNLERVSDHCSNIAGCILEMTHDDLDLHEYLHNVRHSDRAYANMYDNFCQKYIPEEYFDRLSHHDNDTAVGILASDSYDA
jgi:phosphate:Na+ symporter